MPVFDFSNSADKNRECAAHARVLRSGRIRRRPRRRRPMLVLDNRQAGVETSFLRRIYEPEPSGPLLSSRRRTGRVSADILQVDARFVSLLKWLGENHINVRLSGENREDGYAVYKIRETAFGGGTKLSAEDGFLQFMIERLLASSAPGGQSWRRRTRKKTGDDMKLTSIQSITDFMTCAGRTHAGQYPSLGQEEPGGGPFQ